MTADQPPFPPPIMQCVRSAAHSYRVPQIILLSIMKVEAGRGLALKNTNGSTDLGWTGINDDTWIGEIEKHGIRNARQLVQHNDCYNIHTGAWVLKRELRDTPVNHPDFWRRVGNYHSKTPRHNLRYQGMVFSAMLKIKETRWR